MQRREKKIYNFPFSDRLLDLLTGRWVSTLETVQRLYEIKKAAGGKINVMDSADGELFFATNQRVSQKSITFDLIVPSSGTTTKNRITLEGSELICCITYGETWLRKDVPGSMQVPTTAEKREFLGEWTDENEEVSIVVRFKANGRGVKIEVEDRLLGTELRVCNPRWGASSVSFRCFDLNGGSESYHQFRILGVGRADHIVTLKDQLRRWDKTKFGGE